MDLACTGTFIGIATVAIISQEFKIPLLVPSLGATAALIYGIPESPFAQPRNVIMGHAFSAVIGVSIGALFGLTWWSTALATALALIVMQLTKSTHPPAGATALIAVITQASPIYILTPVAVGAVILVLIGLLVNNISPNRSYPSYWV